MYSFIMSSASLSFEKEKLNVWYMAYHNKFQTEDNSSRFFITRMLESSTLVRLGFLRVVFPGGGGGNLTPSPPSYLKKNLYNINITL